MTHKNRKENLNAVAKYLNRYFELFPSSARGFCDAAQEAGIGLSEGTLSKVRSGSIPPTFELILALKFLTPWTIDKILDEELKRRQAAEANNG